ncbi:hypothetical protein ACIHFD_61795 [Nonomuraea sp. NPDC051941]|uniref:hypothetical protein n=1 Tax=Nonomuraea sp. NPDC051941 TaxID=3364373 RepID=UPI0037CB775D
MIWQESLADNLPGNLSSEGPARTSASAARHLRITHGLRAGYLDAALDGISRALRKLNTV